jgi:hypothetical protein
VTYMFAAKNLAVGIVLAVFGETIYAISNPCPTCCIYHGNTLLASTGTILVLIGILSIILSARETAETYLERRRKHVR